MNLEVNLSLDDLRRYLEQLRKRKLLQVALLLGAGIIAVIILAIYPTGKEIYDDKRQITRELSTNEKLQQKLVAVQGLPTDPDFAQTSQLEATFYSKNPYLQTLVTILEVARNNGITGFNRWDLSPGLVATPSAEFASSLSAASLANRSASQQDSESFTLFVEIRANYWQLINFLHDMENYAPFSSVTYAQITNNLIGLDNGQFEILVQYYTPTLTGKLEQPLPQVSEQDRETLVTLNNFAIPNFEMLIQDGVISSQGDNPFLPGMEL